MTDTTTGPMAADLDGLERLAKAAPKADRGIRFVAASVHAPAHFEAFGPSADLAFALFEQHSALIALARRAVAGGGVPRDEHGRDAYDIIRDCNHHAAMKRAGIKDRSREPLLGPPSDMAVSRVLLEQRPDLDATEADRLAVLVNDALAAIRSPA